MSIVMAVVNRKGGVGKSTMSAHIAAGLATLGYRVGLIDTDSQGHSALMLGMPEENGLFDVLIGGKPLDQALRHIPKEHYSTLDLAAQGELFLLPGAEKTHKIPHELDESQGFIFVELVEQMTAEYNLDVIVIDTNPTMSKLDGAIWLATDAYLYVVECERLSFDGLQKAMDQLNNFTKTRKRYLQRDSFVLGIIPNKFRANTELHRYNISLLADAYPESVWNPVTLRVGWANATNSQQLVYTYAPTSQEARDAWAIVEKTKGALFRWEKVDRQ